MGVRTKYRAAESKPDVSVNVAIVHDKPAQTAEEAIANAAAADASASKLKAQVPDDATVRLQRQIEELRKSEQMQHQYAQTQAQAAAEVQRIHHGELQFLQANPELLRDPRLTQRSFEKVLQGGELRRGSPEFLHTIKHLVLTHQANNATPAPPPPPPSPPEPEYTHEEHDMPQYYVNHGSTPVEESNEYSPQRRIVSAPVSREGGGYGSNKQKVTLSPQEREIAKLSGISEQEYARNKLKMPEYFLARGREDGGGR